MSLGHLSLIVLVKSSISLSMLCLVIPLIIERRALKSVIIQFDIFLSVFGDVPWSTVVIYICVHLHHHIFFMY